MPEMDTESDGREHLRGFVGWRWGIANYLDSQTWDAHDGDLVRILSSEL